MKQFILDYDRNKETTKLRISSKIFFKFEINIKIQFEFILSKKNIMYF
jgi:hypothetical protein